MISRAFLVFYLFSALALWSPPPAIAVNADKDATAQSILHALDYLAVDYPQVIIHGEIINASEYKEQQEFAAATLSLIAKLPEHSGKTAMEDDAQKLISLVSNRATGLEVQTLCRDLSVKIISAYQIAVAPSTAPPLENAATLYENKCAECHGATGFGNGPRAAKLDPKPINFHPGLSRDFFC